MLSHSGVPMSLPVACPTDRHLAGSLENVQGRLVCHARENNTCNEAGIRTGFERGTLNSFQITIMKLRTTAIRIVIRVRCS